MNNLNELCCDSCRDKVAQIEQRAQTPPGSELFDMARAYEDRRELLLMMEALLTSVARSRMRARAAETLLVELMTKAEARLQRHQEQHQALLHEAAAGSTTVSVLPDAAK